MTYQEAYNVVAKNRFSRYFAAVVDGKKLNLRLFVSGNTLCQYKKGAKKWGREIDLNLLQRMASLKPVSEVQNKVKIFRRNLDKLIKHLSVSHLWSQILIDAKALQKIDDTLIQEWANTNRRNLYEINEKFRENGILPEETCGNGLVGDIFNNLFDEKCIKTINYYSWNKDIQIELFANAITKGERYSYRWHKGYDNSISVMKDEETLKAWYSEEYTDCGNGHYYLALSATHAIFYEND